MTTALLTKTIYDENKDYLPRSLAAVGDIDPKTAIPPIRENIIKVLRDKRDGRSFEHLPLLWLVLHWDETGHYEMYEKESDDYNEDIGWYSNLLNSAPCTGPKNYLIPDKPEEYNSNWSWTSRLVWPNKPEADLLKKYDYSGLDYLTLFNLYSIVYEKDFRKLTTTLNEDLTGLNYNEISINIYADNHISGGNVIYQASNSIYLMPGFQVDNDADFIGIIEPDGLNFVPYSDLTECYENIILIVKPSKNNNFNSPKNDIQKKKYDDIIKANTESLDLYIYPNPTKNYVTINSNLLSDDYIDFTLCNIFGTKITQQRLYGKTNNIYLENLPAGTYIIYIYNKNNINTYKIIKD
jgi:hypothetical protein